MTIKGKNKKNITYIGKSQKEIDNFPPNVTDVINAELTALQFNYPNAFDALIDDPDLLSPENVKPPLHKGMDKTIGLYAKQLTIKSKDSYRVIYVAKFEGVIYVLHAFKKKTNGVSKSDCSTAKVRYKFVENLEKKKAKQR